MDAEIENFTTRAKDWIKEAEPTAEQLHRAYAAMVNKLKTEPHLASDDTEHCLQILSEAFQEAGGDLDVLIVHGEEAKAGAEPVEYKFDPSPLYSVDAVAAPRLGPAEKLAVFIQLKEQLKTTSPF